MKIVSETYYTTTSNLERKKSKECWFKCQQLLKVPTMTIYKCSKGAVVIISRKVIHFRTIIRIRTAKSSLCFSSATDALREHPR